MTSEGWRFRAATARRGSADTNACSSGSPSSGSTGSGTGGATTETASLRASVISTPGPYSMGASERRRSARRPVSTVANATGWACAASRSRVSTLPGGSLRVLRPTIRPALSTVSRALSTWTTRAAIGVGRALAVGELVEAQVEHRACVLLRCLAHGGHATSERPARRYDGLVVDPHRGDQDRGDGPVDVRSVAPDRAGQADAESGPGRHSDLRVRSERGGRGQECERSGPSCDGPTERPGGLPGDSSHGPRSPGPVSNKDTPARNARRPSDRARGRQGQTRRRRQRV